jgi:hypothetical protein
MGTRRKDVSVWFYAFALFAAAVSLLTQDVIALSLTLISALLGIVTEDRR